LLALSLSSRSPCEAPQMSTETVCSQIDGPFLPHPW
jgi:hypothetical protein